MGEYKRELLPDPPSFYESRGLTLVGRGKWRTTRCDFHGGSDSIRINTESGAFVCMACGIKGGDVVAYAMQADDSDFLSAIKALGAYVDDGKGYHWRDRPRTLSARDAMEVFIADLHYERVVIADIRRGVIPDDEVWGRYIEKLGRIETLAQEYRA